MLIEKDGPLMLVDLFNVAASTQITTTSTYPDIFYPEAIYPITQKGIVGFLLSKDLLNRQKERFYATHRFSRKNFNPCFSKELVGSITYPTEPKGIFIFD